MSSLLASKTLFPSASHTKVSQDFSSTSPSLNLPGESEDCLAIKTEPTSTMHVTENNENWILISQEIIQRKRRAKGLEKGPRQANLSSSIHAVGSKVALL